MSHCSALFRLPIVVLESVLVAGGGPNSWDSALLNPESKYSLSILF